MISAPISRSARPTAKQNAKLRDSIAGMGEGS
jgi:hypothetical protein